MFRLLVLAIIWGLSLQATAKTTYADPTAPPRKLAEADGEISSNFSQSDGLDNLKLQAIVISKKTRFAIINGERFFVGDEVLGYTVKAVARGKVDLLSGEDAQEHFLYDRSITSIIER